MKRIIASAIVGFTLLISGCSSHNVSVGESSFLHSNEGFEETAELEGTKTYIQPNADFSRYENIYVAPIKVIAAIDEKQMNEAQKKLSQEISIYLTREYKEKLKSNSAYHLVESADEENTLIFEGSISSVNVEFDELSGMNFMPMMFVGTMIARATFIDGNIRILGEGRLKDAQTGEVLIQMMRLHKGKEVNVNVDELIFEDVKPTLDDWLQDSNTNLQKLRKGILKHQKHRS